MSKHITLAVTLGAVLAVQPLNVVTLVALIACATVGAIGIRLS